MKKEQQEVRTILYHDKEKKKLSVYIGDSNLTQKDVKEVEVIYPDKD